MLVQLTLCHALVVNTVPAVQTVDGIARSKDGGGISFELKIHRDGQLKLAIRNVGKRPFAYDASRVNLCTDSDYSYGDTGSIRGWLTRDNPFDPAYKKGKMMDLRPGEKTSVQGNLNPGFKIIKGHNVKARLYLGLDGGAYDTPSFVAKSGLFSFRSPITKGKMSLEQSYGLRVVNGPDPDRPRRR